MKLKSLNIHERDKSIFFDEKPHIYYINGDSENVISVTSLVHDFFPKFDADKIIDKMMNSRNWYDSKYYGMTKEEIIEEWEDNRNFAAHLGTLMHKDIELFYNGEDVENNTQEFSYFLDFKREHENLSPFRTEWAIFDEDLKLAGTIDMVFQDDKGNLVIYDWKRSREIKETNKYEEGFYPVSHLPNCNFWHYSLQLNIYRRILEEKYGLEICEMYILSLHPENENYIKLKIPDLSSEVEMVFEERRRKLNGLEKD